MAPPFRAAPPRGSGHRADIGVGGQPAGEHRGRDCVEEGLAGECRIQGDQATGGGQQGSGLTDTTRGEGDLRAQQVCAGLVELGQRAPSAMVSSLRAASGAPARSLAEAAATARAARTLGSGVNVAAYARRVAAAATPPRDCARTAEVCNSAATASSGARVAQARCQARRSGSRARSVTSARAR